jgi:hypothetical protein
MRRILGDVAKAYANLHRSPKKGSLKEASEIAPPIYFLQFMQEACRLARFAPMRLLITFIPYLLICETAPIQRRELLESFSSIYQIVVQNCFFGDLTPS